MLAAPHAGSDGNMTNVNPGRDAALCHNGKRNSITSHIFKYVHAFLKFLYTTFYCFMNSDIDERWLRHNS